MKFEIDNNKLERVIFKYLTIKLSIKETPDGYYFSEDGNKAHIVVKKDRMICFVNIEFLDEIESFFSIEYPYSIDFVSEYVENILGVKLVRTAPYLKSWIVPPPDDN
jgi:hypothetical protein